MRLAWRSMQPLFRLPQTRQPLSHAADPKPDRAAERPSDHGGVDAAAGLGLSFQQPREGRLGPVDPASRGFDRLRFGDTVGDQQRLFSLRRKARLQR